MKRTNGYPLWPLGSSVNNLRTSAFICWFLRVHSRFVLGAPYDLLRLFPRFSSAL
jgi:hypothetical protein